MSEEQKVCKHGTDISARAVSYIGRDGKMTRLEAPICEFCARDLAFEEEMKKYNAKP